MSDIFTKILQSKTLLVSWLTAIVGILMQFSDMLSNILPAKYAGILVTVIGAINLVLRVLTVKPLSDKTSLNQ